MGRHPGIPHHKIGMLSFDLPKLDDAVCRGQDLGLFFPRPGGSSDEAKEICRTCPVIEECLLGALERNEQFGVWGGLTPRERRALRRAAAA